jgi:uncharacterized protein (TIGR02147 family)
MINIFEYLDYRKFLRNFLAEKKQNDPRFSQRFIHRKMNIADSSGFIANVIAGKKNLSDDHVRKLGKILKLTKPEKAFFENLVRYNHAETVEEKNNCLKLIIPRQKLKLQRLHPEQMDVFSKWYYVFLRELIAFFPVKDNFAEAARMLDSPVKPSEVQEAFGALEKMGLVARDSNGFYQQCDKFISTGDETASVYLAHFQLYTMDLAKLALQTVKPEERDISIVACSLSPEGFGRVKEAIQLFRKQVLAIAHEDTSLNRVFQCNIQFFPVTKKGKM